MLPKKTYKQIARFFHAWKNCIGLEKLDMAGMHEDKINYICHNYLPSGSGFDVGTTLNFGESKAEKLVFDSSYHAMNEVGMYTGWIDFKVIITPSLLFDFDLKVKGPFSKFDDGMIKDYILHTFNDAFGHEIRENI